MELPNADSVASTELQCDIQPGALRQRYSVQWNQILQNGSFVLIEEDMFNLTLNVTSSLNGSQYQCEVTIIHDGLTIRTYTTGRIVILASCENNDHCMTAIFACTYISSTKAGLSKIFWYGTGHDINSNNIASIRSRGNFEYRVILNVLPTMFCRFKTTCCRDPILLLQVSTLASAYFFPAAGLYVFA